jgi:TonB family protein
MAPIAKELDTLSSALAGAGATPPAAAKPQPAAVEMPVTVNGARTVEGSDKREPFSENTHTVLVFANGAVIRLASGVASGQLLFLTNDRTKKEVVCQVVKSKNYSREAGYVELEFTEAAPGFWGMRFSSAGAVATAPVAAKLPVPVSGLPEKSLLEKLSVEKAKTPSVPVIEALKPAGLMPAVTQEGAKELEAKPVVHEESKALPAVPAAPTKSFQEKLIEASTRPPMTMTEPPKPAEVKPTAATEFTESVPKIPTLSEFLTNGTAGPELKALEKEAPAKVELKDGESPKPLTEQDAELHGKLSALIFAQKPELSAVEISSVEAESRAGELTKLLMPKKKEAESSASAPLSVKANPAPGTSTFDFETEEVKIPAWLEPLARNSPASAAVFETRMPETKASDAVDSHGQSEQQISGEENSPEYSEKSEAVLTLSSEGPTPNFGSSLALDSRATQGAAEGGSRKGLMLGLLAAGLLVAAGGGWYWYSNQPQSVAASGPAARGNVATEAAPSAVAPVSHATVSPAANFGANPAGSHNSVNSNPVKSDSNGNTFSVEPPAETLTTASEPITKPKLGDVHLSAPVVNRKASGTYNNASDSEPTLNDGLTGGDPGSLGLLANKGKQPVAPLQVGGDVKQARLISSVPPVYPQLAKNQRLSGDVTIDALIDVHGNVSAMKVISGPALLHQAAMDALRQWKYQSATLNGLATPMHLTVTLQFKLP